MPPSSDRTAFFQRRCTFVAHCLKLLSDDQGPVSTNRAPRPSAQAGRAAVIDGDHSVPATRPHQQDSPRCLKLTGNAGLWFDSWAWVHGLTDKYDRLSSALVSEYANPWSAAQIYVQCGQTLTCSYAALPRTLSLQQLKMDRAGIPRELYSEERRFYHMQNYLSGSPQVLANIQAQMEAQGGFFCLVSPS